MSASMSKSRHRYCLGPYERASTTFVSAFPMAIRNFVAPKLVAWSLCHYKQLTRYPRVSHELLVVFSRDSRAIARTQQQPRGARARIHVPAHGHFSRWFAFLSRLLPVVSLQLEASTHGTERPSLASHNRAILVPHCGTALSGSSFFLYACRPDAWIVDVLIVLGMIE